MVSGGTGFVGYWMQKTKPWNTSCVFMDSQDYVERWWFSRSFESLIHLANVSPSEPIRFCAHHKVRLLYISSGAVYDQHTEYAENKRRWERECLESGVDVVIARLFTFFGERLDGGKAIVEFTRAARAGEPIRIWGDGNTVRSYMYGKDMGKWLWAILKKGKSGEAYDVGSDKPITMLELARRINKAHGNKSEIVIERRPEICTYYMPRDVEKTRRLLD